MNGLEQACFISLGVFRAAALLAAFPAEAQEEDALPQEARAVLDDVLLKNPWGQWSCRLGGSALKS